MSPSLAVAIISPITGLLGVVLGHLLAGHSQSRQFAKASKKDEFRSLLDVLGTSVRQIKELKSHVYVTSGNVFDSMTLMNEQRRIQAEMSDVKQLITSALLAASQALDDRLFIDTALTKNNVRGDWKKIEEMAHLPGAGQQQRPQQEVFNVAEFTQAWMELARKIRRIAEEDL